MAHVRYSDDELAEAVATSTSYAGVLRRLSIPLAGGNYVHIKRRIETASLDTEHFLGKGHGKSKASPRRRTADEVLVMLAPGSYRAKTVQLRRALIERGVPEVCSECGQGTSWNGKFLQLEIDHIDGDWLNCTQENLRFLDSNCHTQQSTSNRPWKYVKT